MSFEIETPTPILPSLNPTIMNRHIAAKMAASLKLKPIITITPPDVKIEQITGKGYGLIVTKEFKSGESIFVERPLIMASHGPGQSLEESITNAIYTARPEALAKFYKLHNPLTLWSYWDDAHLGSFLTLEENIWNSNCLPFPEDPLDPENHKSAIFELGSRINHSCLCNAEWEWNAKGRYLELFAWTDLKAGDEVTIDYLGLPAWEMTAKERRSELARDYNFLCRCKACDSELAYWEILEEKEQKVFSGRFLHEDENCNCGICDHRGPEDYHCADSECYLQRAGDLLAVDDCLSDCEGGYYWEYVSVSLY